MSFFTEAAAFIISRQNIARRSIGVPEHVKFTLVRECLLLYCAMLVVNTVEWVVMRYNGLIYIAASVLSESDVRGGVCR